MAKVRVTHTIRVGRQTLPVKKVPQLAPLVVRSIVQATTPQLRVLAEEARELIRDRIFTGTPQQPGRKRVRRPAYLRAKNIPTVTRTPARLRPLKWVTVLRKKRQQLDGRILLATGDYIARGIEVYKGQQQSGVYYMVRPEQRKHRASGLQMSALAKLHEFGSARRKIPARPVWRPAVRSIIEMFRRSRESVRAEALRIALRGIA